MATAVERDLIVPKSTDVVRDARPILKWAGGKRQLLGEILKRVPERIHTYYEPFVGGGAVFFALAAKGAFKRAVLSDQNEELIEVYRALQKDVEAVIAALKTFKHSEDEYYRVRESRPTGEAQCAARLIYLNKTGYNGLYRVNRSGEFNVPFGRYKNPSFLDPVRLRAAANALAGVKLKVGDFEATCGKAKPGDFVYLDPPYVPLSKTANFSAYHRDAFGLDEHARLATAFADLETRGVPALLSNSDTPETRKLYARFDVSTVLASRIINSNAARRGTVPELLVKNNAKGSAKPRSR